MSIDPIAFSIGPIDVYWYGISYGVGLALSTFILIQLNKKKQIFKDSDQIFDLVFWIFLVGVILGGRLGYVLFYNLPFFIKNPSEIIAIWKGGMSFHGGLIGSILVGYFYTKKHKIDFWKLADLITVATPLTLSLGRLANFVNRELPGRVIKNEAWQWLGYDFGDGVLRYPSPLFQASTGPIIFIIMLWIFNKKPKKGVLFFSFIALYGFFRTITEFWRAPDEQIGYLIRYFTLGQLFSFSMLIIGLIGVYKVKNMPSNK